MDKATLLHDAQEIGSGLERVGHGILGKIRVSFREAGRQAQPATWGRGAPRDSACPMR